MFDIIGDIHGHADHLKGLLVQLGYSKKGDGYFHPFRKVIFVGDYIDRGPKIKETVRIVRSMVENDSAIALMGNHEYNAYCFATQHPNGGHLRSHSIKNISQHYETLRQFRGDQREYDSMISWFGSLPLWLENEDFAAVHATFNSNAIGELKNILKGNTLDEDSFLASSNRHDRSYPLIDMILKGQEYGLPSGSSFLDKDGNERYSARIKWWEDPCDRSLNELTIPEGLDIQDQLLQKEEWKPYPAEAKPVFFGHYWLKGSPQIQRSNVCCLDYSVAKGGVLTAYRYNGEKQLSDQNMVYV